MSQTQARLIGVGPEDLGLESFSLFPEVAKPLGYKPGVLGAIIYCTCISFIIQVFIEPFLCSRQRPGLTGHGFQVGRSQSEDEANREESQIEKQSMASDPWIQPNLEPSAFFLVNCFETCMKQVKTNSRIKPKQKQSHRPCVIHRGWLEAGCRYWLIQNFPEQSE